MKLAMKMPMVRYRVRTAHKGKSWIGTWDVGRSGNKFAVCAWSGEKVGARARAGRNSQ